MGKNVLIFVEIREGKVKKPSLEAVSEGHRLAKRISPPSSRCRNTPTGFHMFQIRQSR